MSKSYDIPHTETPMPRHDDPDQGNFELIHYEAQECASDFTLDPTNETVWATQQQIADAFGISPNTVSEHLGNIFREGELDQGATTRKFRGVTKNGRKISLLHYSLDAILSVGYRVSSKRLYSPTRGGVTNV